MNYKFFNLKNILIVLFCLLLLAPVSGELWRIPIAGLEFLPSDLLILVIFVAWLMYRLKSPIRLKFGKIGKMIIVFLFVLLITYIINLFRFPTGEMIKGFAYLGRFAMYLILPIILFDILVDAHDNASLRQPNKIIISTIIISLVLISLLGFLQLKYFPSFYELGMELKGWDPHIGRLLSTWFDPNFVGGYISFVLGLIFALWIWFWNKKNKKWLIIIGAIAFIGVIAVYLTYSRSAYLTFMAVIGILALLKSRKLLIAGALIVVLAFSFSPRVQERSLDAWDSGKALFGLDSQKPIDDTAQFRIYSWGYALDIIKDYPWLGIGYNRYAYELNKRGHTFLDAHDSGGSDSSLLTIWATSGLFGLLVYLAIGFVAFIVTLKRIRQSSNFKSYIDSGLLAGFGGLMIHSIFVNSLLFPLMMVYLMVGLGLLDEK